MNASSRGTDTPSTSSPTASPQRTSVLRAYTESLLDPTAVRAERERRAFEHRVLGLYLSGERARRLHFGMASPKVIAFHKDPRSARVLVGGNKSAKTVAGAWDATTLLAGRHPWRSRRMSPPVFARAICPELPGSMDRKHVQRDTVRDWTPPAWLRGGSWDSAYSVVGHTLHYANESVLEFLSFEQVQTTHAGQRLDFEWFDEECPRPIWMENMGRLARGRRLGEWCMTYVPVEGLQWLKEEIYDAAMKDPAGKIGLHHVTIWDNEHNLPRGFIQQFSEALREDDAKVRLHGLYGARSGLVFDVFSSDHLVEDDFAVVRE